MNYKRIFLSLLAMASTASSYGKSSEVRIKELQEAQFQKQLELFKLGKMITEIDEFIRSYGDRAHSIRAWTQDRKASALERNNGKPLSSEEADKVGKDLEVSTDLFLDAWIKSEETNVKEILVKGLYDQENLESYFSFESMRFIDLRGIFESLFLKNLVDKYATCAQELAKIDAELDDLEELLVA